MNNMSLKTVLTLRIFNFARIIIAIPTVLVTSLYIKNVRYIQKLKFNFRHDDIFIVTYPKSGTTWLQMILYQLLTDGNMDIQHISVFSPFFERLLLFNKDLETIPSPRVFKSHLPYKDIPKGNCKYIYVGRNGKSVAVSQYNQFIDVGVKMTFSKFFELFRTGKLGAISWFDHVGEWWLHRNDINVLFLRYEDLHTNLEDSIRKISAFCDIKLDEKRLPDILEKCSIEFMKKYEHKFFPSGEFIVESGFREGRFIRKGKVGGWTEEMSEQEVLLFEKRLAKIKANYNINF